MLKPFIPFAISCVVFSVARAGQTVINSTGQTILSSHTSLNIRWRNGHCHHNGSANYATWGLLQPNTKSGESWLFHHQPPFQYFPSPAYDNQTGGRNYGSMFTRFCSRWQPGAVRKISITTKSISVTTSPAFICPHAVVVVMIIIKPSKFLKAQWDDRIFFCMIVLHPLLQQKAMAPQAINYRAVARNAQGLLISPTSR